MLSYRHGFHAGNHADVLKHLVQVLSLDHLLRHEEPFLYVDTHAGAGLYDLDNDFAQKNAEFIGGIDSLRHASKNLCAELRLYLNTVDDCCVRFGKSLTHCYPGSPLIALQMKRKTDRAAFFELHSADADALYKLSYRDAKLAHADGFAGLRAIQPPKSQRGLILIDPPYEDKSDYQTVVDAVSDALDRFPHGIFAVWYPLLPKADHKALVKGLMALSPEYYLRAELEVMSPEGQHGMYGSGMFVINPPWKLSKQLPPALKQLESLLGKPVGKSLLEYRQP
ncbi:23S rRNA (adenine(2030)-N(6))-methyltransferase RlmJ [Spongiibacter sp. KMU-158]|uniref:Ribosomal RNA large subunit methyltransferase J n=1 Tax=Spongiibacter pelagi TaxID=2760804 RepID=A0A927C0Z5_9GAMM|nr:23S rRNA (adenine(2030)-N(6))-methyltransferase RlmJ [Spongiibacter pelagi]MBD2857796.1 23S rRNA (adenine(2030)-N(6))-methyltransferase RlmJ [Spongiibacter pelagi]